MKTTMVTSILKKVVCIWCIVFLISACDNDNDDESQRAKPPKIDVIIHAITFKVNQNIILRAVVTDEDNDVDASAIIWTVNFQGEDVTDETLGELQFGHFVVFRAHQVGKYDVKVIVTDAKGNQDAETYNIEVIEN